jgi:arabinose-5-phosphate isomerase
MSPADIERSRARIENLKHALEWIGNELNTNPQYSETFNATVEVLSKRRQQLNGTPLANPSSQVHFSAIGKSGDVAKLLVSMLTSVGVRASFLHPTEALHGDIGSVRAGDAVIFISNRGETSELLELLPLLKSRNVTTLAMTAGQHSPLARQCNWTLGLPNVTEMSAHDHAPVTSTVVALALGQLLVAASMDDGKLDLESYAQNHPGGAIGKRIFVRVEDIMIPKSDLPLVTETTNFAATISTMTEKALGAVFIVKDQQLLGIVTEKDLREAMKKYGPAIFERLPTEYMNPKPITIQSRALAVDALRLMENRTRPLNFLPVVNDKNEPCGLLRLHDLIKCGIRL